MTSTRRFLLWHCLVPTLITGVVFIILRRFNLDEKLALVFFNGTQWPFKDDWLLNHVIHNGGHKFALAAYGALVLVFIYRLLRRYPSAALAYAITSITLSVLAVNLAKHLLHFPCPWDAFNDLGQLTPYAWLPQQAGCFPSGHASSGYAWLSFYYVARLYSPQWRATFAALAIAVGLCFGIAQQIRGAHFISHDLICLYLCWMVASLVFYFWPKLHNQPIPAPLPPAPKTPKAPADGII